MSKLVPVILAGGAGTRLWPLSTASFPKQFLPLSVTHNNLFQETLARASSLPGVERVVVVTTVEYTHIVQRLIADNPVPVEVLAEPMPRNTAAAMTLAAMHIAYTQPDAMAWFMPSDHTIDALDALLEKVTLAQSTLPDHAILTFGVQPTRPDTQYGYILRGEQYAEDIYRVERFAEKPALDTALSLYSQIGCYWNSGMFLCGVQTLLIRVQRENGIAYRLVKEAYKQYMKKDALLLITSAEYAKLPAISIDKMLLEEAKELYVCPVDIGWADIGSWRVLAEKSANNNEVECNTCFEYMSRRYGRVDD